MSSLSRLLIFPIVDGSCPNKQPQLFFSKGMAKALPLFLLDDEKETKVAA
jgi:hypothetical protein